MKGDYLIVDDEPDICWLLEHVLTAKGLRCQKALSAQAALKLMQERRFHLAILDVSLPDMNGLELARRLRQLDPFMPIVLVSGCLSTSTAALAQAEGLACACLNKPFLHEDILSAVEGFAAADEVW